MAIDLILQWEGVDAPEYARRFRTAAHITNFTPALKKIATLGIAPAVTRNFSEGGRPPWDPLDAKTLRNKIREGYQSPHRILVASGALEQSATNPTNYQIDTHQITAKPGPAYWIFHQTGTSKMPQRVIMNLQIADQRVIGGIFNKFIEAHLAKNGLRVRGQKTIVGGGG